MPVRPLAHGCCAKCVKCSGSESKKVACRQGNAEITWMRKVFSTAAAAEAESNLTEAESVPTYPFSNSSPIESPANLPMLHPATRSQSRGNAAPTPSSTGCGKLPSIWMRATTILDTPEGSASKQRHLRSLKSSASSGAASGSVAGRLHGRSHGGMSLPLKSELDQYVARHGNPFGYQNHVDLLASDPTDRPSAWRPTDIQLDLNQRRKQKRALDVEVQQYFDRGLRNSLHTLSNKAT